MMDGRAFGILIIIAVCFSMSEAVFAGPPFRTDDPEPCEYRHWEIYVVSQGAFNQEDASLTAPHIEINYGIFPNAQLHLITPFEYVKSEDTFSHYGYGDTELGFHLVSQRQK